jgi:hypothetical protein
MVVTPQSHRVSDHPKAHLLNYFMATDYKDNWLKVLRLDGCPTQRWRSGSAFVSWNLLSVQRNAFFTQGEIGREFVCDNNVEAIARPMRTPAGEMPGLRVCMSSKFHWPEPDDYSGTMQIVLP